MRRVASLLLIAVLAAPPPLARAADFARFAALRNAATRAAAAAADPVGLRALQAFDGPDLAGGDGTMARAGIDLALLYQEYVDYVGRGQPGPFATSLAAVRLDAARVLVEAVADDDADTTLLAQLQALGLATGAARGRLLSGWLPMLALDGASRLPGLRVLRPLYAYTNAGVVTSQGDVALQAAAARATYQVDGAGVTVGAISDSFNCRGGYATDVGSGDLPPAVAVLEEESGCAQGLDEGRAMLQIVHDLAPGAALAFHSGFNGPASFAQGIAQLAANGAGVIVDDVGYLTQPMFQDGVIAQAVDAAAAQGVVYLSAAGNFARQSYESDFRPSGQNGVLGERHDFDPGPGVDTRQLMQVAPGGAVIVLQWDQPFFSVSGPPGATTDLELVEYASPGGQILRTSGWQNIGNDAVDVLEIPNSGSSNITAQLAIERKSGPAPAHVKFLYYGGLALLEFGTSSSTVFGHANAKGARALAAVDYRATPAFGVLPFAVESYSSRGGTTVRLNTAGAPVLEPRAKPEIAAADGGDTTFFHGADTDGTGFPNFYGTSAAAPHAAAVAALLRNQNPNATVGDVDEALLEGAIDMAAPGFDQDSGAGLVQADRALAYGAANAGAGALIGFGTTPSGTGLGPSFAADLFAGAGLKITDNDPATALTSATALPGAGPTAAFSGRFLLAPGGLGGNTWIDLEFLPLGRSISFDFATPTGQVALTGTDVNGTQIFSAGASGSTSFAAPGGGTWLAGSVSLPSSLALRKLRIAPTNTLDSLAVDNVGFSTDIAPADAQVPIPAGALVAAALAMAAAGARRLRDSRAQARGRAA